MIYNLSALGIEALNPMQEEMLEKTRKYRSLVLLSPTGTGKTLGYLLPLVEQMPDVAVSPTDEQAVNTLVLVPSRELAIQTRDVASHLCSQLRCVACYGGRPTMEEHRTLRGVNPQMVVGTPGRILDHIQKGNISADSITTLVIDEFDKSLELGFQQQMSDIMSLLKKVNRRILLSATNDPKIPDFVGVHDVEYLSYLTDNDQEGRVQQYVLRSKEKDKLPALGALLRHLGQETSMVFLGFRDAVERVSSYLDGLGFTVSAFHGGMEQKDRERALFRFQSGAANILVCTDLAGRGLDITSVENIIHYHLPPNEETLIHRNGRTARWDRQGHSYIILGPEEHLPEFVPGDAEECILPTRLPSPTFSRWEVLYIGKGKKDKVNKVDIVGFLTKVGGLQGSQLGMISVTPHWSFVAVERKVLKSLFRNIQGQKIKGQRTIIEVIR